MLGFFITIDRTWADAGGRGRTWADGADVDGRGGQDVGGRDGLDGTACT